MVDHLACAFYGIWHQYSTDILVWLDIDIGWNYLS